MPKLIGWGWDPASHVWTVNPAQGVFDYRACPVAGCEHDATTGAGLCTGCRHRWRVTGLSLEAFLAQPFARVHGLAERLCRVCCTPGHMRPASNLGICQACDGQRRRRGQTAAAFVAGDDRFPPAEPRPTIGTCTVAACGRFAAFRTGLCSGHQRWWLGAGRPELPRWCVETGPLLGDQKTRISLIGVAEVVETEFLFGVQSAIEQGHRPRPSDLRSVVGQARRMSAHTFEQLLIAALSPSARRFVARTVDALALAAKTPESESEKDVWDLRVWGFKGTLSFVGTRQPNHPRHRPIPAIRQGWLRNAAKRWAAVQLPLHRSESTVEAMVAAVAHFSTHLSRRPDGGEDPAALGKEDVTGFLAGLRAQVNQGQLHPYMHTRTVAFLRRFLRECRDLGSDRHGVPLTELPSSVAVAREEVPLSPKRDPDDEVGDAIPAAVLAQLLTAANLGLLSDDGRRRFEIGLEVGRRPGELCRLGFDCLAYDERADEAGGTVATPVLVHNMTKVGVVRCRLPIHQRTATLIREQQAAVRARFPDTPITDLVLFPAVQRPKGGRRPIAATGWAKELQRWARRLELFEGWLDRDGGLHLLRGPGGDTVRFDPARVFPYALRHSYAQRHVDAGTPVEVLKELMGHDCLNTTSSYYRISAERKRRAVKAVLPLQVAASGGRLTLVADASESDLRGYLLSQVAVPMGSCVEPANVKAGGTACDFRYRCFGCAHFRTDPSYLPELRGYLSKLLAARERLTAALPELAEWARREALPTEEEVATVRRLIGACESILASLDPPDRAAAEEAIELLRKARASLDTTVPIEFLGVVAQSAPALFPALAAETRRAQ
ncbi:MAG: tyrosine-type recombinase/integrase [Mycobacteriales bacterium]